MQRPWSRLRRIGLRSWRSFFASHIYFLINTFTKNDRNHRPCQGYLAPYRINFSHQSVSFSQGDDDFLVVGDVVVVEGAVF